MNKTIDNACFFTFFTTLDLIWLKFCPKTTPTLDFSADFQWNMLKDSININNCNWNQVVSENKRAKCKTSKNYHFWGNFHNNGIPMGHAQNKSTIFFFRNNKTRSKAFRIFLFDQNIMCFSWVINVFLFCVMLFC